MTKAYSATESESPVLLVAPGVDGDVHAADQRMDDRCRVAAGVSLLAGRSGLALEVLAGTDRHRLSWGETSAYLGGLTPESTPAMADQLRRLPPSTSLAVVADTIDEESIAALVTDAPRFPAMEVWLLTDAGDENDWRANRVVTVLRAVGARVTLVHRPLPAPEVSR
jgi:hypothetical protein